MADTQPFPDGPKKDLSSLIDLVTMGPLEEIELELERIETPIPKAVLAAAEKTGEYSRVQKIMDHVSLLGVEEGVDDTNMLLWALRERFFIAAGQLVEAAFSDVILEKNSSGQNTYDLARGLGATNVVKEIEAFVLRTDSTTEAFFSESL